MEPDLPTTVHANLWRGRSPIELNDSDDEVYDLAETEPERDEEIRLVDERNLFLHNTTEGCPSVHSFTTSHMLCASINVQRSVQNMHAFLETHSHLDLILAQEPWVGNVKSVPSLLNKSGDESIDTQIHRNWILIRPAKLGRAVIYLNRRLERYQPIIREDIISHPDVVLLALTRDKDNKLFVMNVYNDGETNAALDLLIEKSEDIPMVNILAGDFNIKFNPLDESAHHTDPRWYTLNTWTTDHGLALSNREGEITHPPRHGGESGSVLDLVYLSPDRQECSLGKHLIDHNGRMSDHYPILFAYHTEIPEPTRVRRIPEDKISDFTETIFNLVKNSMILMTKPSDKEELIEASKELERIICTTWTDKSKETSRIAISRPWWDHNCADSHREFLQAAGAGPEEYRQKKQAFFSAMRKAKRNYFDLIIRNRQKDQHVWELLPWLHARKLPTYRPILNAEGQPSTSQGETFDTFASKYCTSEPLPVNMGCVDNMPQAEPRDFPEFSITELRQVINTTPAKSSPGHDSFSWTHIKETMKHGKEFGQCLLNLFNASIEFGHYPDYFKKAVTVIIPKPKKKTYDTPKSYRPIVLLSCIGN